jgi:aminoglycoside phosphotransferase (APT) family kinase protein
MAERSERVVPMSCSGAAFIDRDNPPPEWVQQIRQQFPTERETDELLVRKMQRRAGPPYHRIGREQLLRILHDFLSEHIDGTFAISEDRWFTGGVSKIQLGFTLAWNDPVRGPSIDRLVVRMDPSESLNATSRRREWELLRAFEGVVPVPRVFWLDDVGRWFPEPALIYQFVDGVTKPSDSATGKISGLGTNFGAELRRILAPQFLAHLARIHTFDHARAGFSSLDCPQTGSTQSALWQLNRARRVWEEDRGEDFPLMEVAANWLERNLPAVDHVSVVHGDYRSGNFLFDERSGEIKAWLDWERGHLGDRHRDLAWMTQEFMGHYSEDGKTYYVCGLIPLDEFYARYEAASGLRVDHERLVFYRVLCAYQIAVATLATAYRVARLGKSHQDILLARVKGQVPLVAKEMRELLRGRL